MNEPQIIFRQAEVKDFIEITRLHFIDRKVTDKGAFNIFYDKVKLYYGIGAQIIVAQDKDGLAGVIIFIKDSSAVKKAFLFQGYLLKFLFRFIAGKYGFNKRLLKKFIFALKANLNLGRTVYNPKISLPKASVISIVVEKKHRRQSIGSKLVDMASRHLLDGGISGLHLTVMEHNFPAIAMYEKLGFKIVGRCLESTGPSFIMLKALSKKDDLCQTLDPPI